MFREEIFCIHFPLGSNVK